MIPRVPRGRARAGVRGRVDAGEDSSYADGAVLVVDSGTTLVDAGTAAFDCTLALR